MPLKENWLLLVAQMVKKNYNVVIQQTSNNKVSFLVAQFWPCHMQIVD